MSMAQESSVVSSVKQLPAEEQARQEAARAERDAELARQRLQGSQRRSRSSMLVAALATLLGGVIAVGAFVIVPGQRRAEKAYSQLHQQYMSLTERAGQREDALMRQVQGLRDELKRAELNLVAVTAARTPESARPRVMTAIRKLPLAPTNPHKTACTCLASDPLCDCIK